MRYWPKVKKFGFSQLVRFPLFSDVIVYMTIAFGLHLCLTTAEMVLMKVIYILRFSRIAAMDEYFISTVLIMFNSVVILIIVMFRMVSKDIEVTAWYNFVKQDPFKYGKEKTSGEIIGYRYHDHNLSLFF